MNLESITRELKRFGAILSRHRYPLVGAIIVALFAFTVYRIDFLSATQRDEEAYQEQLKTVTNVEFDDFVISEILRLTDTNVQIQSDFPDNRTNPF